MRFHHWVEEGKERSKKVSNESKKRSRYNSGVVKKALTSSWHFVSLPLGRGCYLALRSFRRLKSRSFAATKILTLFCERGCLHSDVEMAISLGDSDVGEQRCH
eukprot:scaffold37733_cov188-Skeletonema_marinoi.AAC.5